MCEPISLSLLGWGTRERIEKDEEFCLIQGGRRLRPLLSLLLRGVLPQPGAQAGGEGGAQVRGAAAHQESRTESSLT